MKSTSVPALLSAALLAANCATAHPKEKRTVDTRYPYKGPAVPIGDWVDQTVNGNGKGFPRLVEAPAVTPKSSSATNNINVIQVSYAGTNAVNIHFQTPFGIGAAPTVKWGSSSSSLSKTATGSTKTYARTPPCSAIKAITQCSEFFHNVHLSGLTANTKYYYQIPGGNGTTPSQTLSFTTARAAGDTSEFTVAILNDMGYTNALGTHQYLASAASSGDVAFAWHGGDISYADDWYSGILPCELTGDDSWPVCYNGSDTTLPGPKPYPTQYTDAPLPKGELPDEGGPQGGDISTIYESNWDLWQNWMNAVTTKIPYMTLPGNHEAACAEFDGPGNIMTAYLNEDKVNSTASSSALSYWSCPPSQRNFTAFQNRFQMPGAQSGGVGNFWYSFNYGLVHFVSIDSETDFPYSPEYPFIADTDGASDKPTPSETYPTDSGPFGYINGSYKENESYEQYNWLINDLKSVDKTETPWIIAMGHRPMYSSQTSSYQANIRDAFQAVMLEYDVDMYLAGHIHWYERLHPITSSGEVDNSSVVSKNAYTTNPGVSMVHVVNGNAGNIESHSELDGDSVASITAVLDAVNYGFSKLTVNSAEQLTWTQIKGVDGSVGDSFTLTKKGSTAGHYVE